MKKAIFIVAIGSAFGLSSCKKCSECHYDGANGEVELGEYCDDDLKEIESHGYHVHSEDTTYEVHCHEH